MHSIPRHAKLKVCPKCLGTKVNLYLGGYAGRLYRCSACGYVGFFILETTVDSYESFRNQMEESRKNESADR